MPRYLRRFYIAFYEVLADPKRSHDLLVILGLIASAIAATTALIATILIS